MPATVVTLVLMHMGRKHVVSCRCGSWACLWPILFDSKPSQASFFFFFFAVFNGLIAVTSALTKARLSGATPRYRTRKGVGL